MKRRIRIGAASLMVAAGLIGAVAAPASAAKPSVNYGKFGVSTGICSPSAGVFGPVNTTATEASGGSGGRVDEVFVRNGGHSRFQFLCND
jgi:hypothetical protein